MGSVLQLQKVLQQPPTISSLEGVEIRHYHGPDDIQPWLELRRKAFAREKLGVREWSPADFEQEFFQKSWWDPQRMLLAEQYAAHEPELVGAVTLALRGVGAGATPVVHWLCVHPQHRRRGIARLLLETLEARAWENGFRQVCLETHVRWRAAGFLYAALGYEPS